MTRLSTLKALQDHVVTFTARIANGENLDKQAAYIADELISLCFGLATGHRHLYRLTFTPLDDTVCYTYTSIILDSSHTGATRRGETMIDTDKHKLYYAEHLSLRDLLNGGTL